MKQHADCIFCRIVRGEAPAHFVDEDELTLSFLDLFPVARGHTLIVTREHFANILEARPQVIAAVGAKSVQLAQALNTALQPDGIGVYQLNGAAAGQTVFHYHQHLIPRHSGDTLEVHSRKQGEREELQQTATLLRRHLAAPATATDI